MQLVQLQEAASFRSDARTSKLFDQYQQLLTELNKRTLPDGISSFLNSTTEELNNTTLSGKPLRKLLKQHQTTVLKRLEKELKLTPKHYYRTLWMVVGMSAFGIPLGMAFGISIGNLGMLGIGLPIGMAMGIAVGNRLDKKAFDEGRQLDVEMKY